MKEELLKVIEANLPAEVGKTLQIRLADAERLEKENERFKQDVSTLSDQNLALEKENERLKKREEAVHSVASLNEAREKTLNDRENKLERTLAENRAEESEKRAEGLKEVLGIVFKSPVYKRSYSERNDGQSIGNYVNGQCTNEPSRFPLQKDTHEEITNE